jgi:hypothetical protein
MAAFTDTIAINMLAREGIAVVWRLHIEAADAYRLRQESGAETLIAIADAAEEWLRRIAEEGVKSLSA